MSDLQSFFFWVLVLITFCFMFLLHGTSLMCSLSPKISVFLGVHLDKHLLDDEPGWNVGLVFRTSMGNIYTQRNE